MQKDDPFYEEAYLALKNSKLFSQLDEDTYHELLSKFKVIHWKKGETIDYETGKKYCHFIVSGRLKITQIDPESGRSIAPFLLSSGDIFDVFSFLDGEEHTVFPIALDKVTALYMPLEQARECLNDHPEFNKQFLPYLGEMLRQLESFSTSLVFHDTTTRLANLILRHTHPQQEPHEQHFNVKLINNLSHESLAEMIGSVRSVVSSQMNRLKEENIILSKRGYLAVKNFEKLLHKLDHFQYKESRS